MNLIPAFSDCSIDIETLGHRYDAPVISIGAVEFDRETGKLGSAFYQEIDIDSALRSGTPTAGTLVWWLTQNKDAQRVLYDDNPDNPKKMGLSSALLNFCTWYRGTRGVMKAWGNGATFDITVLEHAIHKGSVGLGLPWHYLNIRDMGTIIEAAETLVGFDKRSIPEVGTHHNALDDAKWQALAISGAWRALRFACLGDNAKTAKTPAPATTDDDEL